MTAKEAPKIGLFRLLRHWSENLYFPKVEREKKNKKKITVSKNSERIYY